MNLENQFSEYNSEVSKELPSYSGLLGLSIGGSRTVNIATRAGFVYVRLRDNLNEVVQAYNDKVSPVYDLPVLIQRVGNRWHVVGKDTARYDVWGTSSPFLPAHAGQHEFNRAIGSGGDTVFVYDDQFMPLLVYPSGTSGAGMLMVAPYVLQRSADFIYVGNTGTGNLLIYKPTNNQAIMGLVVLNKTTGNPEVLIASGTPFSGGITGTHQVLPYLAYPASHQEPLYGFRLVSGTVALRWENLYNVRQFIGGNQSTGTSSGSLPTFITGSIPFAGSNGSLTEDNATLFWNNTNDQLFIGKHGAEQFDQDDVYPLVITSKTPNNAVGYSVFTYGTGTLGGPSPTFVAWRSRGTYTTPDTVKKDDSLITISTLAYDGSGWNNNARIRFYADQNWITGSVRSTRMDFEVTPSGSATRRTQFQIYGDSVNIPTGSTYNVGGNPHTHTPSEIGVREKLTANRTYYVRTDGSNSNNGLTDSSGGAFLTIAKAISTCQSIDLAGYTVTIQIGSGTFSENLTVENINGSLNIQGALTELETITSATISAGSAGTRGTITKTGAFTGDSYAGKLAYFVTDGEYRVIRSHDNNTATVVGTCPSSTTQNVKIYGWGTTIAGGSGAALKINGQNSVSISDIEFTSSNTAGGVVPKLCLSLNFTRCNFDCILYAYYCNDGGLAYCVLDYTSTYMLRLSSSKFFNLYGSWLNTNGTACVDLNTHSHIQIYYGTDIGGSTPTYGILAQILSTAQFVNASGTGYARIANCGTGIRATNGSQVIATTNNQYASNTTNESADSATYAYID